MLPGDTTDAPSVPSPNPACAVGSVWPGAPNPPTTAIRLISDKDTGRAVKNGLEPQLSAAGPTSSSPPPQAPSTTVKPTSMLPNICTMRGLIRDPYARGDPADPQAVGGSRLPARTGRMRRAPSPPS